MNRIDEKFAELGRRKEKAFLVYLTAGDPDLDVTGELVLAFEKAGADIVELGVPFSDPLADGPTIQASSQRALQRGVTLLKILDLVKVIRRRSQIPLALMTYYNPVFHFGEERFIRQAKDAGVDGVIIPDLPVEEADGLIRLGKAHDVSTVFFLSPTTTPKRMRKILAAGTGFIYYVSITGVTGARENLPKDWTAKIKAAKRLSSKPICLGFGVSAPEQVRTVTGVADGVIVGSAVMKEIEKNSGKPDLVENVAAFVRVLADAAHTREFSANHSHHKERS